MNKKILLNKDVATEYYSISNTGFYYTELSEQHGEWLYPTVNNKNPAGWFIQDPSNMVRGDFNGDGLQDAAFIWTILPHVVERNSPSFPTIFINDGVGKLSTANTIIDGPLPTRHMLYRSAAADFNQDGRDDLIMTSSGLMKRDPSVPGGFSNKYEPIAYLLSGTNGKLRDASGQIEGQEAGGLPQGFSFGHDLCVGDFNGDRYPDVYTGKVMLINKGDGSFANRSNLLPAEMKPSHTMIMSSASGDLNKDGIDDLIISQAEPELRYVLLSGANGFSSGTLVRLPDGTYGKNTKSNFITTGDLNGDGLVDIVIAETRSEPYYVGQHLQIIINKGNGIFADETKLRINNQPFDQHQGEGEIFLVDVNVDGHLDIVHSTGTTYVGNKFTAGGLDVFMNRGDGSFLHTPNTFFPAINNRDISGYENTSSEGLVMRSLPINLDKKNGIDFVSFKQIPFTAWPQIEPNAFFTHTVTSLLPINRLPLQENTYIALDTGANQTAGSGYMLYKAAFNRTPDAGGLGYWINQMDKGMNYSDVANNFVNSTEFKTAFGGSNPSVNTLVTKLYNNVLNRTPDAGGLAFWQNKLSNEGWSTADVLGFFSTSGENVTNVTPLIANGIAYQQFAG
jgi:hypothetical protein